jgi:hypothetical protein
VNADIRNFEVEFIDEADPRFKSIGVKGVGEVAAVEAGPGHCQCRVSRDRKTDPRPSDPDRKTACMISWNCRVILAPAAIYLTTAVERVSAQ